MELKTIEWNIQGAASVGWAKSRNNFSFKREFVDYLIKEAADVIVLTEFVTALGWDYFQEQLLKNKYIWFLNQLSGKNGVLIIVKEQILGDKKKFVHDMYYEQDVVFNGESLSGNFKPDFLHVKLHSLNIIGIRIQDNKLENWIDRKQQVESVYRYISEKKLQNLIILGDFNHGSAFKEADPTIDYTVGGKYKRKDYNYQMMRSIFTSGGYSVNTPQFGVYPIQNNQFSWLSKATPNYPTDTPIKLDHMITSKNISVDGSELRYVWTDFSDHALLTAKINL